MAREKEKWYVFSLYHIAEDVYFFDTEEEALEFCGGSALEEFLIIKGQEFEYSPPAGKGSFRSK